MKLRKIKIENFRGYKENEIKLSDLNVIIGKNDVGKSTMLDALNVFFENEKPLENDTNVYLDNKEIIITCCFKVETNMPIFLDSTESKNTQTLLENEYLLDNDGLLQIKKVFEKGKIKKTFIIANYPNKWKIPLITLKIDDLKQIVDKYKTNKEVKKNIKKSMRDFIFKQEKNNLKFTVQEIEINSKDKDSDIINVYEKLKSKLPKFMLFRADRTNTDKDSEIVDITKAITKNAVSETEQEFENIKQEIKQKIQDFSNLTLEKLKSFNKDIANSLSVKMQDKSLESLFTYEFESDNNIPFNKRGSGIKRLFLLSFFLADAQRQGNSNMIYAIEEPETSQHPNFQKIIIKTLQTISQNENRQVFITTHTPEIVKLADKDSVIFIKKDENNNITIKQKENLNIKETIESLGLLPYVSYKGVMFVEGETDIEFFKHLNNIKEFKEIFDISQITFIALKGKGNIETWAKQNYLKDSNVKQLYFLDKDGEKQKNIEERENVKLIITQKREIENYYPKDVIENYFKDKLGLKQIFTDKNKNSWDNEDIAKIIYNKSNRFKELDIKNMFNSEKIWEQINYNNLQGLEEIKGWFKIMKEFFV